MTSLYNLALLLLLSIFISNDVHVVDSFQLSTTTTSSTRYSTRTISTNSIGYKNMLSQNIATKSRFTKISLVNNNSDIPENYSIPIPQLLILGSFLTFGFCFLTAANAAGVNFPISLPDPSITQNLFDPSKFQPVCPASDGFYQFAKSLANGMIGKENVIEYGPLVASVLLRVRLELCVFESFVYEAVMPFIKQKGLSWILPFHETLETFIAGTIFAVASNFILLGSTKIFTVILIYMDALFGFPLRLIGNLIQKFSSSSKLVTNMQKPNYVQLVAKTLSFIGDVVGGVRKTVEVLDTFVGRYLVFGTTVYILFKFAHYKFFNYLF